ncbi:hypothetical protein CVT26_007339 [Gymnopilus dilepis]|uniref:Carbonic anhydrase n=1 Tax=Gymnopilus dilepis TaxID=231916 RepID=A0A409VP43_9AGAR|nr:hypothetical protein CVT26_007339 [Gymnopilus dilepis]
MYSKLHQLVQLLALSSAAIRSVVAQDNTTDTTTSNSTLAALADGNAAFMADIATTDPGLLQNQTIQGQAPKYLYLGCSDSRVPEGTIFNAKPGTLLVQRNNGNLFYTIDASLQAILGSAVYGYNVTDIIVMGHYGCGAVGAAFVPPPPPPVDAAMAAIQNFVDPMRELYRTSTREEVVELRDTLAQDGTATLPGYDDPGFRALVEENVKANVERIAASAIIQDHYYSFGENQPVFIHGLVYDVSTGQVYNLGVSVGPDGVPIPEVPFPLVS